MRPLSGGHYRLSQRTTGVPEPEPVAPNGEIHLGPGRLRKPFLGNPSYLRVSDASSIPAPSLFGVRFSVNGSFPFGSAGSRCVLKTEASQPRQ